LRGFPVESTDRPPCRHLIRLLGDGPTGMGWKVNHKRCPGLCDHTHDTCSLDFIDPATGAFVYYSNGRRGRTIAEEHHQRITELNTTALA